MRSNRQFSSSPDSVGVVIPTPKNPIETPPETAPVFTFRHVYHVPSGVSIDCCGGPIVDIRSSRVAMPMFEFSHSSDDLRCAAFPPPHEENSRGTKAQSIRMRFDRGGIRNVCLPTDAFFNRRLGAGQYWSVKITKTPLRWQQIADRSGRCRGVPRPRKTL